MVLVGASYYYFTSLILYSHFGFGGGIHKLRHTFRGQRGRQSMIRGGGRREILNFVTSHLKNMYESDITRINQIETIPLKSIGHCTLNYLANVNMTFNVHLVQ